MRKIWGEIKIQLANEGPEINSLMGNNQPYYERRRYGLQQGNWTNNECDDVKRWNNEQRDSRYINRNETIREI